MATEMETIPEKVLEISENEKNVKDCADGEAKTESFFKSNGWKTTFFVVLVNFRQKLNVFLLH